RRGHLGRVVQTEIRQRRARLRVKGPGRRSPGRPPSAPPLAPPTAAPPVGTCNVPRGTLQLPPRPASDVCPPKPTAVPPELAPSRRISLGNSPGRQKSTCVATAAQSGGQVQSHPVRKLLVSLLVLLLFIAACVWGPAFARLPLRWLWLANVGFVCATVLAWF